MLSLKGLTRRRIADVPLGNLVYSLNDGTVELGLCIERPSMAGVKAVLRLLGDTRQGRMPIVDTGISSCIDLGAKPELRWVHPLRVIPRTSHELAAVGYLLLSGNRCSISSHYSDGRGDRMYWDLETGAAFDPGADDFVLVAQWALGLRDADGGSFIVLASYPDDYGKPAGKSAGL